MKNILALIALSLAIVSCQKEIDVDLNETSPVIVLEGNYSSEDSTVVLQVSLTSSYFNSGTSPSIDNLAPIIKDANGVSQTLVSYGDGIYALTDYIPTYNSNYTLEVLYDGQLYSATSTLSEPVTLDPITYEYTTGFFGSAEGNFTYLNFTDPIGAGNFYIVNLSLNDENFDGLSDLVLQDDRFSDGNPVSRPIFFDPLFQIGDTVGMELKSVDEVIYDYYTEAQTISGGADSAAPANPKSNWNNSALGYFSAYSKSNQEVIIL